MNGRLLRLAGSLAVLAAHAPAAPRWRMQYFYDEDKSSLEIHDLAALGPKRLIAIGSIVSEKDRTRPVQVVSNDGGEHWAVEPLKDPGASLFFIDESLGWMVGPKGIYRTEEGGRNWIKISSPKHVLRVYFLDAQRGWAIGGEKSIYETSDGGKRWDKAAFANQPSTNPKYTVYSWIDFLNPEVGEIVGWSRPPRRSEEGELPAWLDPAAAAKKFEWPTVSISLDTRDGGKTWKASTASVFGRITRLRLSKRGAGLGLLEFAEAFEYPSEVYSIDLRTGKSARAFREKNTHVTDVAIPASGPAYLAGVDVPGRVHNLPVPGKLKMFESGADLAKWTPMEVDYRAVAQRAIIAAGGPTDIFVATDTGMILRLER